MTGNMGDGIITYIINFEKFSLKRLYDEYITHIQKEFYDNPTQSEIHLTQISSKFPANMFKICQKASL